MGAANLIADALSMGIGSLAVGVPRVGGGLLVVSVARSRPSRGRDVRPARGFPGAADAVP